MITRRLLAVIALLALLMMAAGTVAAQGGIYIETESLGEVEVIIDGKVAAMLDGYSAADPLTVEFIPMSGADSYWMHLIELDLTNLETRVVQRGHHWVSYPYLTTFTFGGYNPALTCRTCIHYILGYPETRHPYYDPTTQTYEYEYTPLDGLASTGFFILVP